MKDGTGLLKAIESKILNCNNIFFFWHEPKDAKNLVLLLEGRALFEVYRIGDFSFCLEMYSYMLLREKIEEAFKVSAPAKKGPLRTSFLYTSTSYSYCTRYFPTFH